MNLTSITAIPGIVVLCYLIGEGYKAIRKPDDSEKEIIPFICGIFGGALGVLSFYLNWLDIHATYVLAAAANGVFSGLAATGAHQGYQAIKNKLGGN